MPEMRPSERRRGGSPRSTWGTDDVTTSRTGTAKWLALRTKLIRTRDLFCVYCNRELDPKARRGFPNAIELDHVEPVALRPDLEYDEDNLVLACYVCNRSKGNRVAPGAPNAGYDVNGVRIPDPRVRCRVHDPIKASCPHSGVLK